MSFFFFFQAEDGIRDYKVTGVQTCALPIWLHLEADLQRQLRRARRRPRYPTHLVRRRGKHPHHTDRKSTRLNSSHLVSSYAVFCWRNKTREKAIAHMPPTGMATSTTRSVSI